MVEPDLVDFYKGVLTIGFSISLFAQMINSVRLDGYLIIANCFAPVIKCHLPSTFHLRYTFKIFAKLMGLKLIGACQGSHATVYVKEKEKSLNWTQIRQVEGLSKSLFPVLKSLHSGYRGLKQIIR